jgi:TPR repeat protein
MGRNDSKEVSDFTKELELAEAGDSKSMIGVAHRYYYGIGVNVDKNVSFAWYKKAVSIGSADGLWSLARLFYLCGVVVTKDPAEGERLLQEAFGIYLKQANQGDAYSQNAVGNMLSSGEGVAKSYEQALEWYRLGASNGNIWSMYSLAEAYLYGRGVVSDYDLAIEWFARFAEKAGPDECYRLDRIAASFRWGWDGVLVDYERSMKLVRIGVSYGGASCYATLGNYLHEGIATQKDDAGALECWRKAASLGDPKALMTLGDVYGAGLMVEKNTGIATRYYMQAADLDPWLRSKISLKLYRLDDFNSRFEAKKILEDILKVKPDGYWERSKMDPFSFLGLAELLMKECIPPQPELAIRCYEKIIEISTNHAPIAWRSLGLMYLDGVGVPRDYSESVKCFTKAAMLGDSDACRELGFAYYLARGVGLDYTEAYAWWNIARSLGDKKSEEELSSVEVKMTKSQINDAQARSTFLHNSILVYRDEAKRKNLSD